MGKLKHIGEKGGGSFRGVRLLLCENPLPPLAEAIDAARAEVPKSNFYTEAFSAPLREEISAHTKVPESYIHINAGSELILRQLFSLYGRQVHLITPTYTLFEEIAENYTETRLSPENNFKLDIREIDIPKGTTMFVLVNPNNPNGGTFDLRFLPELLDKYQETHFLIDEAFIGVAGQSVAHLVPGFRNLIVTRTFSKAHSLAGFRVGYAILPKQTATLLNSMNDAYPLARPSEAAAIATLQNEDKIIERTEILKKWTNNLAYRMQKMGIRIFPTETYFFLADFAPFNAHELANGLAQSGFLIKALDDRVLGDGFVRITTSTPENNERFIIVLKKLMNME